MKKLLILSRFVAEYEPVRLAKEGRKAGYKVDIVKYGQVKIEVWEEEVKIDLGRGRRLLDYDLVIMRAASKKGSSMVSVKQVILNELGRLGKKVVNGESFVKYPLLGKIEQGVEMARVGLPVVPFVSFGSRLGWEFNLRSSSGYRLPVMVKGRFGSHGRSVEMVRTMKRLLELIESYKAGNVLIQSVLPIKQWYRCIVCNGKYLGEMRHRQKEKYGGVSRNEHKLVKFNLKKMRSLEKICLEASKLFNCDYCGIDVGWDREKQDWVVFEVNRTAQFKYFEKRTGVNVAKNIIIPPPRWNEPV